MDRNKFSQFYGKLVLTLAYAGICSTAAWLWIITPTQFVVAVWIMRLWLVAAALFVFPEVVRILRKNDNVNVPVDLTEEDVIEDNTPDNN